MTSTTAAPTLHYPSSLLALRSRRQFTLQDFAVPKGGKLGEGRFGQVYKVRENASRRQLVLKAVSKRALLEEGALRQFQREVEIHCRVQHPNIVRMYAYFHDAENCFLVLEYADVGTLYQRIEVGRMAEREAACLFRQLVCAVAYLHRRGILHRDIKPENVFLARDPETNEAVVKLGDLGWAIVKRATSKRTTLCGTVEYLPPEVCRGAVKGMDASGGALVGGVSIGEEYDESFDLYTLGVLLYEMLVGHSPFAGPPHAAAEGGMSEGAVMRRIAAGKFVIPAALPLGAHTLIRALMSPNPRARPSAEEVLKRPWVVALAGATPPTAYE